MSTPKYDAICSLLDRTLRLLKADRRTLEDLHEQTRIPLAWLRKFHSGEIKVPNINRVHYLYEFLTRKKLFHASKHSARAAKPAPMGGSRR
jgi:hypothetical protein